MPFAAPFMLGPFLVDAQGRLAPRDAEALPAFLFRWRGCAIRARLRPAQADRGRLVLRGVLGRIPSSGDATDLAGRAQCFTILRGLPRLLPQHWQLMLLPDHRVLLESSAEVTLPITASGLLTELTVFLLTLAPYLDALVALRSATPEPSGASGSVKI
ncbi:MAG TPA: hypothetical protein VFN42_09915 [Acetobacteraceae bacterium]|nr:hypothetical protein [Acetobacteraceae bacterium]